MARITHHATQRSKERLGLSKGSAARQADVALRDGLAHRDLTGNLRRYTDGLFLNYGTANNIKVYGDHFFVFADDVLITVLLIPVQMRKIANRLRKRKNDSAK